MTEELENIAKREAGSLGLRWSAMIVTVGVYVFVGSLLAGANDPVALERAVVSLGPLEAPLAFVRWFFILLAFGLLGGTVWVARNRLSDAAVMAQSRGDEPSVRLAGGFSHLKTNSLLAWGLADGVALAGTLLAMLTGRKLEILPFAIASGTALLLLKPEQPVVMELAEKMVEERT